MGQNKSTIGIDEFLEETDKLLTVAHNQKENRELDQLYNNFSNVLKHIEEVDFRKYAELSTNEKPRKVHFLVNQFLGYLLLLTYSSRE